MRIDVAFAQLKAARGKITKQQYRTLKGQILAGDSDGAMKGLVTILARGVAR
jgi:hypothetical protein